MASRNQQVARVLGLVSVWLLLQQSSHAFEFRVGGSQGWASPSDPNASVYNYWAQHSRFQIGDSLLFVYSSDHDSVLRVSKEDYESCNTEKPLDKFTDGHTVYKLNASGPHYFISGVADNCHKNEKLIVVVMADRSKHDSNGTHSPSPSPSPTPSPPEDMTPPSPAPAGEESPPPPPAEESNPTPAPSEESPPHKNGAGSGVVGSIALFFASSFALAL
ncbi:early nodulin-like protein 3 [Salvia hispanica]|uniref:early nodulin-like protein 3 n=1 Tax=Salvia hispanica TaxID=49212 RepID=UPI0020095259|nr:early nodulin-like protein 3 [Salvia hispanica]